MIDTLDPKWAGYYFDPNHATAEGGVGGWKIALNLVMLRLNMVAVKDFYWEKTSNGWHGKDCPLGEGICHWKDFLGTMAGANFHGPISLHLEYEIPGVSNDQGIALPRTKEPMVMAAARRDLDFFKARLHEAYREARFLPASAVSRILSQFTTLPPHPALRAPKQSLGPSQGGVRGHGDCKILGGTGR